MAYPAEAIANYFISKSFTNPKKTSLTPLKLIKLIYIAHGFYLALNNKPLINENVEAWQYGPVISSIYHEFKKYGNMPINELTEVDKIPSEDKTTLDFLNDIWEKYGDPDGIQLSTWTHQELSPWHTVWAKKGGMYRKGRIIGDEIIKDYFKTLLTPVSQVTNTP